MVYWTDLDYSKLPTTTAAYRRDHKYSDLIGAFDLESTNYKDLFSFMYIWQFGVEDQIVYGRTWSELRDFILDLREHLHLNYNHKMIVYSHGMRYDFGFFKSELPIDGEIIAKSKNEVVMCTVCDCLEFRDSWQYTEKPLEALGEEIGLNKISGYDYAKIRHHQTELSASELEYCETDIAILLKYYKKQREIYGTTSRIPLTATQRVKRIMMQKMHEMDGRNGLMIGMIKKRQLNTKNPEDMLILRYLRLAFFGGVNYCTTVRKNELIPDCDDWDADSHYIAQILLHRFPKNKFTPLPLPENVKQLIEHTGVYHNKAMLITFRFIDLEAVLPDFAFLPIYTKNYIESDLADRRSMVSHKMHKMHEGIMTLTDVDFFLMTKYYKVKGLQILEVYGSDYGVLPDYITNTCIDLYIKKRSAKAELKQIREQREPTAEEQAAYSLIKSFLNRVYGIFVQDPVRTNYTFVNGQVVPDPLDRISTKRTQYSPVLYQWGVWVASWARYELLHVFGALCLDKMPDGSKAYNFNVLYMDTDSLKGQGLDSTIIAKYNQNVKRRVLDLCNRKRIPFELLDGLGEFERTHYDYFKACGLKQYAFITSKGEFAYHISGLAQPKLDPETGERHSYFDKFDTLAEKMDAFCQDMDVLPEESGLLKQVYGGSRAPEMITDYQGNTAEVIVNSYVLLLPRGFRTGDDLLDTIRKTDPERLKVAHAKFNHSGGVMA